MSVCFAAQVVAFDACIGRTVGCSKCAYSMDIHLRGPLQNAHLPNHERQQYLIGELHIIQKVLTYALLYANDIVLFALPPMRCLIL